MKDEVNKCEYDDKDLVDLKAEIKTLLQDEETKIRPEPLYKCFICPASFRRKGMLKKHEKQGHNNLFCSNCDRTFATKKGLKLHLNKIQDGICSNDRKRKKVPEPLFHCAICPAGFKVKAWLYKHEKEGHEAPSCQQCSRTFKNKVLLYLHKQKFHLGIRFACPACDKIFTSQSHLITHRKNIHEKKKWECLQCDKKLASSGALRKHVKTVHDKIKEVCPICKKELAYLDNHIQEKHEGRVYKCELCKATLSSRTSYITHVKRHQGMRFGCNDCDDSFRDKSSLLRHTKRVHSDDGSRYTCQECGKSFMHKIYLQTHNRLQHSSSALKGNGKRKLKCMKCSNKHLATFDCSALDLLFESQTKEESKPIFEIPFQSLIE